MKRRLLLTGAACGFVRKYAATERLEKPAPECGAAKTGMLDNGKALQQKPLPQKALRRSRAAGAMSPDGFASDNPAACGHRYALQCEQKTLCLQSACITGQRAVRADYAVAGDENADRIARDSRTDCAC